jgi:DNA-binding PadR family transcriptional regulator
MQDVRVTVAVGIVLRVFLDDVTEPCYGYELMRLTGWLERQWEEIDAATTGRPARRWYRLNSEGAAAARHKLAHLPGNRHDQERLAAGLVCGARRVPPATTPTSW